MSVIYTTIKIYLNLILGSYTSILGNDLIFFELKLVVIGKETTPRDACAFYSQPLSRAVP